MIMSKNRKTRQSCDISTDNHTYMVLFRDEFKCPICRPNRGCNKNWKLRKENQNWKRLRGKQWKEVYNEC